VAIVDYNRPFCYLHEWSKALHFKFANLTELAVAALSAKVVLVNKVMEFNPKELFIVLEEGREREVPNLPPNMRVVLVDYDVEDAESKTSDIVLIRYRDHVLFA